MVLRSHYQSSGVVPAISTQKYFPANMQQIMSTWKRFAPPHVEAVRDLYFKNGNMIIYILGVLIQVLVTYRPGSKWER
jgi:hypothetical protein